MEWSSRSGSMHLNGNLPAYKICSNDWKTGSSSSWGLGGRCYRKAWTGTSLNVVWIKPRSKPCLVRAGFSPSVGRKAWAIANSSPWNSPFTDRGLGVPDQGTSFRVSRRPSTAVAAGRSKAKKAGQSSGGRIERRPPSSRRPRPSGSGNEGEHQVGNQGREIGRTEEEELNLTWQEAGLRDRRLGGRFRPERGAPPKEAQRVGGWGRDKSMQRVITPEQQREGRGGTRGGDRSGNRQKSQTTEPSVIKKKKLYEDFDDNPSVIHPPEYYKYGPYGPHAWKGIPVGKLVEGNFATNQVVFFSNVKDEAEAEDREKANLTVDYTNMVAKFDVNVGIQYFYAFARRRYGGPRPDPWKDWTLIAQIAIESGEVFSEQGELFLKMGSRTQDITTRCVAWARPDLTYVRKPLFHLRLEPQEDFLKQLFDLVDPIGETNDSDSYYASLCRLVNVDLDASPRRVRYGYEALDEEGELECLKHVFTEHPVKILSGARYERHGRKQQGEPEGEDGFLYKPAGEETDDESNDEVDGESDHAGQILEPSKDFEGSAEIRRFGESGTSGGRQFQPANAAAGKKAPPQRGGRRPRGSPKAAYAKPFFRSAVRPFSYTNLIEEIAQIRIYLSQQQSER